MVKTKNMWLARGYIHWGHTKAWARCIGTHGTLAATLFGAPLAILSSLVLRQYHCLQLAHALQQHCFIFYYCRSMSAHTWIQTVLLGLLIVNSVTSQTCSTPFDAVFAEVTDLVVSASSLQYADPEMKFFTETLHFTAEETNQVMENAIRHFNTQFGIDFSNVEPNEANQRP